MQLVWTQKAWIFIFSVPHYRSVTFLLRDFACTASGLFTAEPPGKCPQWRTWVASSNCNLDSVVKNPPTMQETQETWIRHLDWDDILEEENGNALQFFCLKNPADRRAGRLQSKGWQRVRYDWVTKHTSGSVAKDLWRPGFNPWSRKIPWRRKWPTHSSILAWKTPWWNLVGYSPRGHKESDTNEQTHFHFQPTK